MDYLASSVKGDPEELVGTIVAPTQGIAEKSASTG